LGDLSPEHPFLAMQLVYSSGINYFCDFATVPIGKPMTKPGVIKISPAIQKRTGIKTGLKISARLVTLLPVRSSDKGVGIILEHIQTIRFNAGEEPSDGEMRTLLMKELEKQYILVTGQWISLLDKNSRIWLYRVKRIWSVQGRPVKCANFYGAHIAIEIEFPPGEPRELSDVLENWEYY
jgi:hypothetical protein